MITLGGVTFAGGAVFDEAHRLKEAKSQRTQAARKLAGQAAEDQLVLFLTGTPVLNRPRELVQPLLMLGVLSDEPGAKLTSRWFLNRFCWDGQGYNGAQHTDELATFLRSCMIRRTKAQVLTELPAKQRVELWSELSPEGRRAFDALAIEIVKRYRRTNKLTIQDLTALRRAASAAKAMDALAWARDFLDTTDEKLIVFAHHIETQHALIDGLRKDGHEVVSILGSQRDVEEHKARFQEGTARVIVCSLLAAGVGHTLTAASTVLMVEPDWTPGINVQAEDRAHRIGQLNAVTVYYMLADDTVIDDYMWDMVEGKAGVIRQVMGDGQAREEGAHAELAARLVARFGSAADAT